MKSEPLAKGWWQWIIQSLKLIIAYSFSFSTDFFYLSEKAFNGDIGENIKSPHCMTCLFWVNLNFVDVYLDLIFGLMPCPISGESFINPESNLVPLSIMLHICTFAQHYGPGHQTNPESTSDSVSCWLMYRYFLVISVYLELISFT